MIDKTHKPVLIIVPISGIQVCLTDAIIFLWSLAYVATRRREVQAA